MRDGYTDSRGRWTARPILFPEARTFADIFSAAKLGQGMPAIDYQDATCWRYATSTSAHDAAPVGHMGGKHYVRINADGTLFCFGRGGAVAFTSSWVKPLPGVVAEAEKSLISAAGSFEIIKRSDGILVTLRDNHGIGARWIALLDEGQSLLPLMSEEDQTAWAAHLAREADVQSIVVDGIVDRDRAAALGVPVRAA
jgi:hypothetical protein